MPWLGTILLVASIPVWYFVDYSHSLTISMLSVFCWSEYWRRAAQHYRRALEYVVSGELTKAIRQENPGLLKLSNVMQEAVDDLTDKAR